MAVPGLRVIAALGLAALAPAGGLAQSAGIRTYCNPLDIDYKYNFEQLNQGVSYRSGADPVIVNHQDEYFLFVTVSGGYWHSKDLIHWRFVTPSRWPFEDNVAPAAISERDTLFLMQSAVAPRPILYSTDPASGRLEFYNRMLPPLPNAVREGTDSIPPGMLQPGPWDPALFREPDDGRWSLYWDSSNVFPIYGIGLDTTRRLAYIELPRPVLTRFIRYQHVHVAAPNLAIGDLRVFGNAPGRAPATPRGLAARRDRDPRHAFITWSPGRSVVGYNILWGIRPDKLYQTYQVFADGAPQLELRALNTGQEYYVAIEAFDEMGVSPVSRPVRLSP